MGQHRHSGEQPAGSGRPWPETNSIETFDLGDDRSAQVQFLDVDTQDVVDEELDGPRRARPGGSRLPKAALAALLALVVAALITRAVTHHTPAASTGRTVGSTATAGSTAAATQAFGIATGGYRSTHPNEASTPRSAAPEGNRTTRSDAPDGSTMTIVVGGQAETVSSDGHGGLAPVAAPSYSDSPGCPAQAQCAVVHVLSDAADSALRSELPGVVLTDSTSLLALRVGRFGPDLTRRTIHADWRGARVSISIVKPGSGRSGGSVQVADGASGRALSGVLYGTAFQVSASISALPNARQLPPQRLYRLMGNYALTVPQ